MGAAPPPNALPHRAEHIGSMLRPRALKQAFAARLKGALPPAAYARILAENIRHAVRLQEEAGLQTITDGEFGRSSWFGFFFEAMEGFRLDTAAFAFKDGEGHEFKWPTCVACGRIRRHRGITTREFTAVRALTERTPKVTMPTPSAFHFFRFDHPADPSAYADMDAYWEDLVAVYRAELAELHEIGCDYVQFDEVPLAMLCDPGVRAQVKARGHDPEALVDTYIDVMRRILADRPEGMRIGMHLCRGNFRGRWMAAGGYGPVADKLFNQMPVDAFFLEYDSERAGDFAPLAHVPADKAIVLGLVSSKSPVMEETDQLRRRLDQAARFVPLERLALSPQCGFASVAGGNDMAETVEIQKLRLVVATAEAVWGHA